MSTEADPKVQRMIDAAKSPTAWRAYLKAHAMRMAWSQNRLAVRVGVPGPTMSVWMTGRRTPNRFARLGILLAAVFDNVE